MLTASAKGRSGQMLKGLNSRDTVPRSKEQRMLRRIPLRRSDPSPSQELTHPRAGGRAKDPRPTLPSRAAQPPSQGTLMRSRHWDGVRS